MTAGTVETARQGGGNGDGLRRSPMDTPTQGVSVRIMAWQPPDTPSIEHMRCLPTSGSALESSEGPTVVVGQRPSGKSRNRPFSPNLKTRFRKPVRCREVNGECQIP